MTKKPLRYLTAFFLIAASAIFIFRLISFKNVAEDSAASLYKNLKSAADQLFNFNIDGARQSFQESSAEIRGLQSLADDLGLLNFSQVKEAFSVLIGMTEQASAASTQLGEIKKGAFSWIIGGGGEQLIKKLDDLNSSLNSLANLGEQLSKTSSVSLPDDYFNFNADISNTSAFLGALTDWLRQPREQHLLILFQNPSEIRPAGGFLGSFADLTLKRGNLINIDVQDIYNPDGQLNEKIIPPKPLQNLTIGWGARDANWFFDFPTSARKVIEFLESSKIYQEKSQTFSGAIAINIEVVRDILRITGSIKLADYGLIINPDNFLPELQKEVEAGDDKIAGQPKRILGVLTPILLEKIGLFSESEKQQFARYLKDRVEKKDAQIYFKNLAIETYLQVLGLGGEMTNLPNDFWGSYLAFVNANVGGGKSDAYIFQNIKLTVRLAKDGSTDSSLTVARRHDGYLEKEWWYKKDNKNRFLALLEPAASVLDISGNDHLGIKPLVNYSSYKTDPDLADLERAQKFSEELGVDEGVFNGRKLIGGWWILESGKSEEFYL